VSRRSPLAPLGMFAKMFWEFSTYQAMLALHKIGRWVRMSTAPV